MPRVRIDNVGRYGVIKDLPVTDLPPEAWSAIQNARAADGGMDKFFGDEKTLGTGSGALAIQPYWLAFVQAVANTYWLVQGANKVYCVDGTSPFTQTNITRQSAGVDVDYAATETKKWQGGMYGGVFITNNGVDVPQFWATPSPSTKLANLTNWDSNRRTKSIRPYNRFLVALNLTISSTDYPHDVLWSHPADAGAIPTSWDETDTTKDCGRYSLSDSQGRLVDGLQLRDSFIIYKEDATWNMQFIGGTFIMKFSRILKESGLMAKDCVTHFKNNAEMHFVVGSDDVYIHNGQNAQSIVDKSMRRWLYNNIDGTYYERSFVVPYPAKQEIWFCFPESGYSMPSLALVWNWGDGKFSMRDLCKVSTSGATRDTIAKRGVTCIAPGIVSGDTSATWDGDSSAWDNDSSLWEERSYSPLAYQLVAVERSTAKLLYNVDKNSTFDGTNYTFTLERTGLSIIGRDRDGAPKNDNEVIKLVTELWPRFEATAGSQVQIEIGTQMGPNDAVDWGTPYTFVVGTDLKINPFRSGRFISVRFSYTGTSAVRLVNYEMTIEPAGTY